MDIERPSELIAYLRECHHITADEQPRVTVLAGGVSNRTVLLERAGGRAWVLQTGAGQIAGGGGLVQQPGTDSSRGAGIALAG